ncbi:hypothetical protein JOF28_001417 [Leucobacter exalbidus]|uniref:Siderophore-interacting protein C-terminal domain-containing protein n=1 Tax=Leucobacter exalbidus TaxID=662960 RepID=A0A940PN86_9MICO|nr:hypothetical protein [Leucobacter exalbidus]MBP1326185.1 hypothetical protein [Leucobacter exalbidus]
MMMFEPADSPQGAPVLDPEGITPVVALANAHDLAELDAWLHDLDGAAYGRVFIEGDLAIAGASVAEAAAALHVPDRVGVTWLRPNGEPGVALSTAVDAWLAEWLWVDAAEARSLQMFTAQHAAATLESYLNRFDCRLEKRWPGCSSENCPKLRSAQ